MKNNNEPQRQLELKIEKIVPNGYGLGFADGLTIFVSLAAAGDVLRVRIVQKKGKVAFAEIVEIVEPSPDRTEPNCQYFGRCGGCDFQQMTYEAQLAAKVAIVRDSLTRIGKLNIDTDIRIIDSPQPLGYRARAQWHLDTRRRRIGYFRRTSHDVIDVENCPVLTPQLQKTLTSLRADVEWGSFWAENVEIEAANSGDDVSIYSSELIEPTNEISFALGDNRYFYDARSFFQGNPFLIEALVNEALGDVSGDVALDLFCGVGLFSLPLARRFTKVFGVEANAKSIESATRNAEHARLENVEFYAGTVAEWMSAEFRVYAADEVIDGQTQGETYTSTNESPRKRGTPNGVVDFILLDPPRAGAEKETIEQILHIRAPQVTYVSCDPATLARDLRMLCETVYQIESIVALDLFPQTHHVETVVRLKLK